MKKIIQRTKGFEKTFKKIPSKIQQKFIEKLEVFLDDENNINLKTHRLKGMKKNEFAFSVTGDVRAVYRKQIKLNEEIIIFTFIDIGKHSQVY